METGVLKDVVLAPVCSLPSARIDYTVESLGDEHRHHLRVLFAGGPPPLAGGAGCDNPRAGITLDQRRGVAW